MGTGPARRVEPAPQPSSALGQSSNLRFARPHPSKAAQRSHNLPTQPTPLIGRNHEVASARQQLLRADVRLLTLTGPPGVGKTRLAPEMAADLLDMFEHGVFFVDLAPIRDAALVAYTIARTLGVREVRERSPFERLKQYLRDRQVLLVLDNFEHVLEVASQVAELLAACPELKILVTSRASLHLRWEHEFPVPPLGLPDLQHLPAAESLSDYPAVALFIERAHAVKPDLVLSDQNARAIAEICSRLDGLPLAIELAATRVKLLPPQTMLGQLQHRLDLLTSGARDLPARHQTLRSAIEWSYRLLEPGEQALFRRLSVFVGGCTREAAEAVGQDGELQLDVLEGLASLVDKSLLRQEESSGGEARFSMLETIREYGLEQLVASAELESTQRRHATFFLTVAERAEAEWRGAKREFWLKRLEWEHDNLRTALRWLVERGQAEIGLRLSGALWRFWEAHGHLSDGQRWLEEALSQSSGAPAVLRARALTGAGALARDLADYERASGFQNKALALWREVGDKRGIATSLNILGNVAADQGEYAKAYALHDESLALWRELGDKWATAYLLDNLGVDATYQGNYEQAVALHRESLGLFRELGERRGIANVLNNLGVALRLQGDHAEAIALCEESLRLSQELGNKRGIALALKHLGALARDQGDYKRAIRLLKESTVLFQEWEDKRKIAECLEYLGGAVGLQGKPDRAARLFGAAEAIREVIGSPVTAYERSYYDREVAVVHAKLGQEAFAIAWVAGRAMPLEQAIEHALEAPESGQTAEIVAEPSVARRPGGLTPREQEVAVLIAQGLTNREVAAELVITQGTAANHIQHILNKLGLHSRAQIAVWAVEHGLHAVRPGKTISVLMDPSARPKR